MLGIPLPRTPKKIFLQLLGHSNLLGPLVFLCLKKTTEVITTNPKQHDNKKINILALSPDRFRQELEILAASGNYRIFKVSFTWQARFLSIFYPKNKRNINSLIKQKHSKEENQYHNFLKKFLTKYYKTLNINCIIGAGIHYSQDYNWALVSQQMGFHYILLHRENLIYSSKRQASTLEKRMKSLGTFWGSQVIVHNQATKDIWIKSGFITKDQISSLGCLRMDKFIQSIETHKPSKQQRKRVIFFSFLPSTGLSVIFYKSPSDTSFGYINLFQQTHNAVIEFAKNNPEIDVIIKTKWGGTWIENIKKAAANTNLSNIKNLSITDKENPHELILGSDTVISFGSTTMLEAAIANKRVIVPHFAEALSPEYQDAILLKDDYNLFDIAESPTHLTELINDSLKQPTVSTAIQQKRNTVFEKYISPLTANSLEQYSNKINEILAKQPTSK